MPFVVRCPFCQARYHVRDDLAGAQAPCGRCGKVFTIPRVQPAAAPSVQQPAWSPPQQPPAAPQPHLTAAHPPRRASQLPWIPIVAVGSGVGVLLMLVGLCAGIVGLMNRVAEVAEDAPFSSGTGFVVHPDGYLLTNRHVVQGPGRLMVRLPDNDELVPATVVAEDARRDIALIKMSLPAGSRLPTLQMSAQNVSRGADVAAFGFPLGDALGSHLKLTTGVISSLPDASNEHMLLLDCTVNPGNSGGPLCDKRGEVVGMVTAKSIAAYGIDSYGMAIPSTDLKQFLDRNLPGDAAPVVPNADTPMDWQQVDHSVSPAILMVLKI